MEELITRLETNLLSQCNLAHSSSLLLCVSGGCDSIAMFHLMQQISHRHQWELQVLHFNHQLREQSVAEELFVGSLVRKAGCAFHIRRHESLYQLQQSVPERARNWRRTESTRLLLQNNLSAIVTAHHADDQTETILMQLLRGVHLTGLQGMKWQNGFFIKPLLNIEKEELIQFLSKHNHVWYEDKSNQEKKYFRNRIRLELLPLLKELTHHSISTRCQNLSHQSSSLRDYLTPICQQNYQACLLQPGKLSLTQLQKLPLYLQNEVLYLFLRENQIEFIKQSQLQTLFERIQQRQGKWEYHPGSACKVVKLGNFLYVESLKKLSESWTQHWCEDICVWGPPTWKISGKRQTKGILQQSQKEAGILLYNLESGSQIYVRYREAGDRFQPHWKSKLVRLKDFLRDQHIPFPQRNEIPLICQGKKVLAIYPHYVGKSWKYPQSQEQPFHITIAAYTQGAETG